MSALANLALGDVTSVEGFIAGIGTAALPAVRATGEGRTNGYAGSIAANIPAMRAGYSYGCVSASDLFLVASVGIADASAGIEFVVYPANAAIGDLAILFVGWETAFEGFFNIPEGWNVARYAVAGSPYAQSFYRVIEDLEPFPITNNGPREGGGYMMNVYRRGAYQKSIERTGTTSTTVALPAVNPDNIGDHAANFVVTTGTPNSINNSSVTPPQEVVNNLEGDSGSGQASIWSIDTELTSSGVQTQPDITPNYSTGSPSIDYTAISIVVEEVANRIYGSAAATIPAVTAAASGFITFKGEIAQTLPLPVIAAEGLVLRSGREVCINSGQSANSVAFAASANSLVFEPSANSIVIEPLEPNRVC